MGKQCADLDLIQQFQIYEMVLKHEDGEEDNIMMQLDEGMRLVVVFVTRQNNFNVKNSQLIVNKFDLINFQTKTAYQKRLL